MADNPPNAMDFYTRFQALREHYETRDNLTVSLLVYTKALETKYEEECGELTQRIADLQLDLADSIRTRRDLQRQVDSQAQQLLQFTAHNQNLKNSNPYIVVLIDGDGMFFNEEYIRLGIEGGKKAANALRSAVLEQYEVPENTEVIAKVICNIQGVKKAMHLDGCLDRVDDWKDFTIGFTQGRVSFDFVDVGFGKERADVKIRGVARFHLRNQNCKRILLGISHDASYTPFIDEIRHDASNLDRLTILEGFPTVRELQATNLPKISFPVIFRSEKLQNRTLNDSSSSSSLTPASTPLNSYAGITSRGTPPPPAPPTTLVFPNKSLAPPVKEVALPVRPAAPVWEPGYRGLDEPITVNKDVLDKIKNRANTHKKKLCNNHYLRGANGCFKGSECPFEHNAKVTPEEMKAIQYLTRLNPCTNGQDCESEYCIYGHHCPSTVNGVCEQWLCRFSKEEHPPGAVIKHPKRRDVDYSYSSY